MTEPRAQSGEKKIIWAEPRDREAISRHLYDCRCETTKGDAMKEYVMKVLFLVTYGMASSAFS